jgi:hypothetical protein
MPPQRAAGGVRGVGSVLGSSPLARKSDSLVVGFLAHTGLSLDP